jgi:hypothetical protein
MPAHFDSLGISFQYPENWTLDDSDARLGRQSVTVYSPGGAFWSVAIHPNSADPAKLAAAVVEMMRQEYQELEVHEVEESVAGFDLVGYDLAFYYLDLTNSARIRSFHFPYSTYTIHCQAEDREYELLERVFQAMTVSLLNGFQGSGGRTDDES